VGPAALVVRPLASNGVTGTYGPESVRRLKLSWTAAPLSLDPPPRFLMGLDDA